MRLTILNHEGDVLLVTKDEKISEEIRRERTVKEMTVDEVSTEFERLMRDNRIAINDDTNKVIRKLTPGTRRVTILNPQIGG